VVLSAVPCTAKIGSCSSCRRLPSSLNACGCQNKRATSQCCHASICARASCACAGSGFVKQCSSSADAVVQCDQATSCLASPEQPFVSSLMCQGGKSTTCCKDKRSCLEQLVGGACTDLAYQIQRILYIVLHLQASHVRVDKLAQACIPLLIGHTSARQLLVNICKLALVKGRHGTGQQKIAVCATRHTRGCVPLRGPGSCPSGRQRERGVRAAPALPAGHPPWPASCSRTVPAFLACTAQC
jgi:hypothetical protein